MNDLKARIAENVRNPLALIALFATLSECAMAVVLLQLPIELQRTFVWFVMVFPMALVIGFFIVMYKKPAVLFSPGDYQNPQLYLDSIAPTSTQKIDLPRIERLEGAIKALQVGMDQLADKTPGGKEIKEQFAEERERLQILQNVKSNNLVAFLCDDLMLSLEDAETLVQQSNSVDDLPGKVEELVGDKWKAERIKGVIANFPKVINDFESLKKTLSKGGN